MTPHEHGPLGLAEHVTLLQRSPVPTLVVNHQRRQVLEVNEAAVRLLGLDREAIVGRPGTDFLLPPTDGHVQRLQGLRTDETANLIDVPTATGVRTAEVSVIPAGVEGVAFVQLVDVTDLREAGARAEELEGDLRSTTAALRTIAGRLAHDLRSPMTSIAGFAQLLLERPDDFSEAERTNVLERIRANIDAVADMTDAILSEADVGAPRPQDDSHAPEDLFELVRAVTDGQLIEAGGTMQTRSTIPTLPVPVGAIRQAVINLVSNSIKYRHPDRTLRVELEVRGTPDRTEIVVRDNGKGLSEDIESLLASGARGASSAGTAGGGLGLAFAQAAAQAVGGTVSSTALEPGAELVISLPVARPTPEPLPADPESTEPTRLAGAQLQRIVSSAPVACFVIDVPQRQIVDANRAACDLLGLSSSEIVGRPGSHFVAEADIAEALRRRVIDAPDVATALRTTLRGAGGAIAVQIWVSAVEGTALAVAQAIPDDPVLGTLQHG